MKTYVPSALPLRRLKWSSFAKELAKAHAALEQFNGRMEKGGSLLAKKLWDQETAKRKEYARALKFSCRHRGKFSTRLLCKIHRAVKKNSGAFKQDIGKIRRRQNWIGPEGKGIERAYFYPPKAALVRPCLNNLLEYADGPEKDDLVQLAVFFAQFLLIHPFMDGNGRVARALIPLFLYKKKVTAKPLLFMSRYFKKHRIDYFYKLYQISSRKNWEGWIRFFLKGLEESSDTLKPPEPRLK